MMYEWYSMCFGANNRGIAMLKGFFKTILCILTRCTPKYQYCYIKAVPSFEDNAVAIYESLPLDKFERIIWSVYDLRDPVPFELRSKTRFVTNGSIRDLYYGIISKYVFTTHGHFLPRIPSNQICVNVWHGMPYKGIGLLDGQSGRVDTYVCSTSELYQSILSRAFGIPLQRVLITGSPRNDLLNSTDPESVWSRAGIDRRKYDKFFFWLPTYRKSVFGYLGQDGVEVDNVFNMVDFPTRNFNEFLKAHNCLCIVKPHPMAPKKESVSTDNLLVIDEQWLWHRNLTLYPLVGQSDFLVSDISSIMIDYMLLNLPIIVCFEDSIEYKKSRTLLFEPIEEYLPGVIVDNYDDLINEISNCLAGVDRAADKRNALMEDFHKYDDFSSKKRVIDVLFKEED